MLVMADVFRYQNPFPTDNFKKYTKKTNPKITILEILVYKIQPEITKFKFFSTFFKFFSVSTLLQSHIHKNKIISKM